MKVLLVEDERRMAQLVARGLGEEGHSVDVCHDGESALRQALDVAYDVVVLDWALPGADGVSVLREWRSLGMRAPVLLLTARGSSGEKVTGLRAGADDYLVKPFDFEELLARLEALHRRAGDHGTALQVGALKVDAHRRSLSFEGREERLTGREFGLFIEFSGHRGDVLTRTKLLSTVWGADFDGAPNVVDVYVGYLRAKLEKLGAHGVAIRSVRGAGYRLVTSGESADES